MNDEIDLLLVKATVRICPVCLEQVEEDDNHWHYDTAVDPLELEARPFFDQLRSQRALALFRLQTDIREHQFAEAEKRWYEGLSVADRFWEDSRRKRVAREEAEARRRAAYLDDDPVFRSFNEAMRQMWQPNHMIDSMRMFLIGEWRPRDLDDWLASDDHLAEVDEALGLSS